MDELVRHKPVSQTWKVKVYLLNTSGNWDDCGTGNFEMVRETQENDENEYFKITTNEELIKGRSTDITAERYEKLKGTHARNDKMLLFLSIRKKNQYEKQGESIIAWIDKDIDEEIAISFLDQIAANETWRNICARTGKNPNESKKSGYKDLESLIMPDLNNVDKIKQEFDSRRDWMICAIQNNATFLVKLREVFEKLEDLERYQDIAKIRDIVKSMVFCDDSGFIELILSDAHYLLIFGALEYETESNMTQRTHHRQFLKEKSFFKKIINIEDPNILAKIQVNFRLNYLKDSVVSSYIDDQTANAFNTMIYYNNYEIYEHIINHNEYLSSLFAHFCDTLEDSISFLNEFMLIVRTIVQHEAKLAVLKKFMACDVFTHITEALEQLGRMEFIESEKINILKIQLVEIIIFLSQIEIFPFYNYFKSNPHMLQLLIKNMYTGDQGLQILIGDLFKLLLENDNPKKNEILDFVYCNLLPALMEQYYKLESSQYFMNYAQELINILSHCIFIHGTRIRYYIIQHKILQDLYKGFKLNNKTLTLSIIRLVKVIISSKDEFLIKYIANYNLLSDIFNIYFQNSYKNNLLSSACLELFEKIRTDNVKKLINTIVDNFGEEITRRNLKKPFERMFLKYEQINDGRLPNFRVQEVIPNKSEKPSTENNTTNTLIGMSLNITVQNELNNETSTQKNSNGQAVSDIGNALDKMFEEKPTDNGKQEKDIKMVIEYEDPLSENLKDSVDSLTKIRNKFQSKDEETKSNAGKSRSGSIDRLNTSIRMQLKLNSAENSSESEDDRSVGGEAMFDKRRASQDMNSDIEPFSNEPQKKLKIDNNVTLF